MPTIHEMSSLEEYAALEPSKANAALWKKIVEQHSHDSYRWYGVRDVKEVERIVAACHWPEGVERLEKAFEQIEVPPAVSIRRKLVRGSFGGDSVDIHAVYRGDLEHAWTRRARRQAHGGTAYKTLYFPLIHSGATSSDSIFWRAAAMVKLADVLTEAGYSVEIVGHHGVCNGYYEGGWENSKSKDVYHRVIVKAHNAPLDKSALVVATCLAGYSRTVGFKAITSVPYRVNSGLGPADYRCPPQWKGADTVADFHNINSRSDAQAFVTSQIARLTKVQEAA